MKRFEEALSAYDRALEIDPEFSKAQQNRKTLSEWLEKQKDKQKQEQTSQQQNENGQQSDDQQPGADKQQGDGNQDKQTEQTDRLDQNSAATGESESQPATSGQTADNPQESNETSLSFEHGNDPQELKSENDQAENSLESKTDATESATENDDVKDAGSPLYADHDSSHSSLQDQQTEQWLRRIPDDPGGLLRRKFLQQYQNQRSEGNRTADESRTLW